MAYLYNLSTIDIDYNLIDLEIFRGQITLVTNVASFWGLTPATYTFYTKLYNKLVSRGFQILAFPCNQFANQEPYNNSWIKHFVRDEYNGTYPLFTKVDVNGPDTTAVFDFLKTAFTGDIEWNFVKFIVDHQGAPLRRFSTAVSDFPVVESFIIEMLDQRDRSYNGTMVPIIGT